MPKYEKFTNSLKLNGFIMNPYYPCVWKKKIEGKQCTMCFHVDNCKISHESSRVINNIIAWLCKDYESIFEDGSREMKVNLRFLHQAPSENYHGRVSQGNHRGMG